MNPKAKLVAAVLAQKKKMKGPMAEEVAEKPMPKKVKKKAAKKVIPFFQKAKTRGA